MKATKKEIKITSALKKKIAEIVDERIRETHVKREDFSELKTIVKEVAEAQKRAEEELKELREAQKRTEEEVRKLAEAQKKTEEEVRKLAEAQKRTEEEVRKLAEAQKRTEEEVRKLAEAQKKTEEEVRKLAQGLNRTREDLGGLARSISYAFENEAYRMLPHVLARYGIEVEKKIVRAEIRGKEINFFGKGRRDGREIYIVGEVKIRLDETKRREDPFKELKEKVKAVRQEYGEVEIVMLLVTHFATKDMLKKAEERGILVVQSYEW